MSATEKRQQHNVEAQQMSALVSIHNDMVPLKRQSSEKHSAGVSYPHPQFSSFIAPNFEKHCAAILLQGKRESAPQFCERI
jgi:hypothetical protein